MKTSELTKQPLIKIPCWICNGSKTFIPKTLYYHLIDFHKLCEDLDWIEEEIEQRIKGGKGE